MAERMYYECALCRGEFVASWSKEEAEAEYQALFPNAAASLEPRAVVCDQCFKMMTAQLPPSEFDSTVSPLERSDP